MDIIDITMIPMDGVCDSCLDRETCPMIDLLPLHHKHIEQYGDDYKDTHPEIWEEDGIDEPECNDGIMVWCPFHFPLPEDD